MTALHVDGHAPGGIAFPYRGGEDELVDEGQARGQIATKGTNQHVRTTDKQPEPLPVPSQRLAGGNGERWITVVLPITNLGAYQ